MSNTLFTNESSAASRQPKTDRLVLARFLKAAAADKRLDESQIQKAHAIILKWAELETSGRLAKLNETQMQGDFLAQIFGDVLGYAGPLDGVEVWHRIQHHPINGETPDAVLGIFRASDPQKIRAVDRW